MPTYHYESIAVYSELGGALRLARSVRVLVSDPTTGAPVDATQGARVAPYVDADAAGDVSFTAESWPVRLTSGATYEDVWPINTPGLDAEALAEKATAVSGEFYLSDFGAVDTTGATDSSVAVLAAIAAWQLTGGELSFPAGTIRVDSQIVLSHDADAQPKQRSGKWVGRGATFNGSGTADTPAYGGTILDLRYSGGGSNLAKIDTRGLGALEITGITFTDNGTSSNPFIHTTNTTILAHHNAFIGNPTKAMTTCDQDAFILGGTNTGMPTDDAYESPFQGYGTVIESNYFARIRRGVLLQTYANSVVISQNTWWANCGSNLADGAAIEFAPTGANYCVGNTVWGNLIEAGYYKYAISGDYVTTSLFMNHCWDTGAGFLGVYYFGDHGNYNYIIAGQHMDSTPFVVESTAALGTNTAINTHQGQVTTYAQPTQYSTYDQPVKIRNSVGGLDLGTPADFRQIIFRNSTQTAVASFTTSGTTWQADAGTGTGMKQWSGSGGSYLDLWNYGVLVKDHTGALQMTLGKGGGYLNLVNSGPPATPAASGTIYVEDGALKYKGSSGTVTVIAPA